MRHFLTIDQLTGEDINTLLDEAGAYKAALAHARDGESRPRTTMALIFDKPSLRTRLSFETVMTHLGGRAVYLSPAEIGLGERETVHDTAIVVSSMSDIIVARVSSHAALEELAEHSTVPVVNAMTDAEHPCQILADLLTLKEHFGTLDGLRLAYVGDADNNVTNSLALAAEALGLPLAIGAPEGFRQADDVRRRAPSVRHVDTAEEAVDGAHVVVTDTWVSMGKESDQADRLAALAPFQVTEPLMAAAAPDAVFLHCLPAYRGKEVTAEVIDGPRSLVFPEAENRLHAQKAVVLRLLAA